MKKISNAFNRLLATTMLGLFVLAVTPISLAAEEGPPAKKPRKGSATTKGGAEEAAPYQGTKIKEGAVYRGNLGRNGVFDQTGVVTLKGVKWKTELGGKNNSSPVVCGDTLFIGAGDGFYALNTADGKVRWKYPASQPVDSSACVADGAVCFTTPAGELVALNTTDGSPKWIYKGKATPTSRGSPAIAYGVVFTPLGKEIAAVGLNNGKLIWTINQNVPDEYSSLALDATTFYGTGHLTWGHLTAYDYETALPTWRSQGPYQAGAGVYFYKTPAIGADGCIYVNSTSGVRKFSATAQGRVPKGHNAPLWNIFLLEKAVDDNELIPQACPTVWKDLVYAGRYDGQLLALNTKDGKIVWKQKYPASILSDPSVATQSGLLYFGCYDGNLYALNAETGEEKWKFKTGGQIFSSPWVGPGVIYVASQDGWVYALE